jgi:hypothetical protein
MQAYANCGWFEQPAPYPAFEYGSLDVIRPDQEGMVRVPDGPGLGVRVDWPAIQRASLMSYALYAGGKRFRSARKRSASSRPEADRPL